MEKERRCFRLKAWHFVLMFLLLIFLTSIAGDALSPDTTEIENNKSLPELVPKSVNDSVADGISFILFVDSHLYACKEMEYAINKASEEIGKDVKAFKLNVDRYPEIYKQYQIPGIPTTFVLKEGIKVDQIIGVVSASNLKFIYKKQLDN